MPKMPKVINREINQSSRISAVIPVNYVTERVASDLRPQSRCDFVYFGLVKGEFCFSLNRKMSALILADAFLLPAKARVRLEEVKQFIRKKLKIVLIF